MCQVAKQGADARRRKVEHEQACDRPLGRTYRRDLSGHSPVGCDTVEN
jgi:hypothetical protein